ncbi:MAG TPA: serine/threonine-protein kinase [Ktedonobacteraceae bacterium]|jgi:serine/threonine protein kinase
MNAEALIGTVLGTCTLQQLIGQGGMGAVYLAQQSRPRRQVAVKVLMPATSLKPHQLSAFLERFRRETDAAASLEHPNIMPVYEYGERGGLAYLVMPYISGGTLRDVMESEGRLSFQNAVNYLEQMAAALDLAHARGVIHRDIKPANMLLTPEGRLLLTDFGLVKILSEHQSEQMRLTGAGAPVGTPDYMSPEQVIGSEVDRRADQYSLGVVLFQMLTGTTPFQGETPMQIASQQLHMQPPAPHSLRLDLPEAAEQVLLRAMAKRPDDRFNSAQEFASAFRLALADQFRPMESDRAGLRKGGLFDPRWQSTGTMAAVNAPQVPFGATSFPPGSASVFASEPAEFSQPGGTGLLSRTGFFPRVGSKEYTGTMPAAGGDPGLLSTGQMMATTARQQAVFQPEAAVRPDGLQSAFFAPSTGMQQQPFPTGTFQQLSPAAQNTTSALTLLNGEQTGSNTIKLTGPVKVVQVPVAPGQYVTGLLPIQKELSDPVSEPSMKRSSKVQKIALLLTLLVLLVGGIGGGWYLTRSHPATTPPLPGARPDPAATAQAHATAIAQANIVFFDALTQNVHGFRVDAQHFFKNGAYHILNQSANSAAEVIRQNFPETTLSYQITMAEKAGDDTSPTNTFGIILRYTQSTVKGKDVEKFYTFEILNETGNYQYGFYKYDSTRQPGPWTQLGKAMKPGKEFHGGHGPNAVNTIRVLAAGNSFTFYVNGKQVGTIKDNFLPSGSMGMLVNLKGTEVAFSNMLITHS